MTYINEVFEAMEIITDNSSHARTFNPEELNIEELVEKLRQDINEPVLIYAGNDWSHVQDHHHYFLKPDGKYIHRAIPPAEYSDMCSSTWADWDSLSCLSGEEQEQIKGNLFLLIKYPEARITMSDYRGGSMYPDQIYLSRRRESKEYDWEKSINQRRIYEPESEKSE